MCGIAGIWLHKQAHLDDPDSVLGAMLNCVVHRGPDDVGVWVDRPAGVWLGHRRLAIIDLSPLGHQPMVSADGRLVIVFNGEIYNFPELRRELQAHGHRFYTATDTETIVHAYEQWGADAIARLRGMFGLAIWDTRTRSLLLARDRAGIKPLHYATIDGRLYFGSEIKSLLQAPDLPRALDVQALDHYLS